jgi:HEPN domain-containing protein
VLHADEIIEQLRREGRICPMPSHWNSLWKILPVTQRADGQVKAPPPLILAAWLEASDEQKRDRFEQHIRWAESFGALEKTVTFLRSIPDGDWHSSPLGGQSISRKESSLKSEYLDAWFRCPTSASALPAAFGVITPCNPFGAKLPCVENWKRLKRLEAILRQRSLTYFRVDAGSRDGNHLEPGFGIGGVPLADLRRLGAKFGQDAIFGVQDGQVSLVSCTSDEVREVCRWSERQASLDPMDRLSPARLAASADEYQEAAIALHGVIRREPHGPSLFLSGQAVELYLKAFLRACGASEGELKRLSHDLVATFEAAEKAGIRDLLALSNEDLAVICDLSLHYFSKDLQYTLVGLKAKYPAFASLGPLLKRMHDDVTPFAADHSTVHYGRATAAAFRPKQGEKKPGNA